MQKEYKQNKSVVTFLEEFVRANKLFELRTHRISDLSSDR